MYFPSSFWELQSRKQAFHMRLKRTAAMSRTDLEWKWGSWYWFQGGQHLTYATPISVRVKKNLYICYKIYTHIERVKISKEKEIRSGSWGKEHTKTFFLLLLQSSLPTWKDALPPSEGKREKRRLGEIIQSVLQEARPWQGFLLLPVTVGSMLQMDVPEAQGGPNRERVIYRDYWQGRLSPCVSQEKRISFHLQQTSQPAGRQSALLPIAPGFSAKAIRSYRRRASTSTCLTHSLEAMQEHTDISTHFPSSYQNPMKMASRLDASSRVLWTPALTALLGCRLYLNQPRQEGDMQ